MITKSSGFSHVVFYQTNPKNPEAIDQIIENANRYLAHIPRIKAFLVAPRYDSGRAVQGFNYDVAMNFIFASRDDMLTYMQHPDHTEFVRFVLNGWMLEDTEKENVKDRKEEFIDHILNAKPDEKRKWAVDVKVPDSERVWAGEQVYDFGK